MADTEEQPSISMTIDDVDDFSEEEVVEEASDENVEEEQETVEEEDGTVEEEDAPEEAPVEEEQGTVEEEDGTVDEEAQEDAPEEVEEVPEETVEEEDGTVEVEEAPVEEQETLEEEEHKSLNLRIAELDYLRECCGNWVGKKRAGKALFLKSWSEKDIKEDESVNYESLLIQLEKLPELVRGWGNKSINMKGTNHFKNLNGHSLQKPLFKEEFSVEEKVAVLEKLITLLTNCAQGKLSVADIESQIDDYY